MVNVRSQVPEGLGAGGSLYSEVNAPWLMVIWDPVPLWTDRYDCKHYPPATLLVGGSGYRELTFELICAKLATQKDATFNILTFSLQSINLLVSIRINVECDETIISCAIFR